MWWHARSWRKLTLHPQPIRWSTYRNLLYKRFPVERDRHCEPAALSAFTRVFARYGEGRSNPETRNWIASALGTSQ
jgi:hypothetical protein